MCGGEFEMFIDIVYCDIGELVFWYVFELGIVYLEEFGCWFVFGISDYVGVVIVYRYI